MNASVLLREDRKNDLMGGPYRFAMPFAVTAHPGNYGAWKSTTQAGLKIWQLHVVAKDAKSVNLGFSRFQMSKNSRLIFRTPNGRAQYRPFTAMDNERHGQLWTPPFAGSEVIVELQVPASEERSVRLVLSSVNSGYRSFQRSPGDSGSCNVDVVCKEGNEWKGPIRSVAAISLGGSKMCTGFLVNNTAKDKKMYFMTANHCSVNARNAPSLVAFWNYQNSTCREPGSTSSGSKGDGKLDQFQTGAIFRSTFAKSDFTLVELDDPANPAHKLFWAGWDATGVDGKSAIGIHHPATDEKRISFENQPTSTTSYGGKDVPGDGTHVRVMDWDVGTTEPGSSGSPLFDQNQRVIGQLHGGRAACGNDESDYYGRFAVSWTGGGTKETSLAEWLDPAHLGTKFVDGMDSAGRVQHSRPPRRQ